MLSLKEKVKKNRVMNDVSGAVPVGLYPRPALGCCQPSLDRAILSAKVSTKRPVKLSGLLQLPGAVDSSKTMPSLHRHEQVLYSYLVFTLLALGVHTP